MRRQFRAYHRARTSRVSVVVLAPGRSAQTVMRRVTAAGYSVAAVLDDADAALQRCEQGCDTVVLSLVEPSLLSREALHAFDLRGVRVIGVVSHQRHRAWARLLPLLETVWLFAPPPHYKNVLSRHPHSTAQSACDEA